ncbi:hypothetical protein VNO78_07379 [Psophocarpus tetragonolobus]|uniref:Uncharacterized protein n=1 Tax=Psophocarpus tetragonolobus TaxID=3891 RepID=A0AAN9SW35_PSOTE
MIYMATSFLRIFRGGLTILYSHCTGQYVLVAATKIVELQENWTEENNYAYLLARRSKASLVMSRASKEFEVEQVVDALDDLYEKTYEGFWKIAYEAPFLSRLCGLGTV